MSDEPAERITVSRDMPAKLITGKVAAIIDKYSVVLNIGRIDNVTKGMEFIIYENGGEIKDPDTKESLGTLDIVKATVMIEDIQEKISTAKTCDREPSLSMLSMNATMRMSIGRLIPLSISEEDVLNEKHEENIKIGDLVKQKI